VTGVIYIGMITNSSCTNTITPNLYL